MSDFLNNLRKSVVEETQDGYIQSNTIDRTADTDWWGKVVADAIAKGAGETAVTGAHLLYDLTGEKQAGWDNPTLDAIEAWGKDVSERNTNYYTPGTARYYTDMAVQSLPEMALDTGIGIGAGALAGMAGGGAGSAAGAVIGGIGKLGKWGQRFYDAYNGSSKLARGARFLTPSNQTLFATAAQTPVEAAFEGQRTMDDYIEDAKRNGTYQEGVTENEARNLRGRVFRDNMGLLGITNAIENHLTFGAGKGLTNLLKGLGKSAVMEGLEEGAQQIIPKYERGQEWHLNDQDVIESALVGGAMGGIMHGAGRGAKAMFPKYLDPNYNPMTDIKTALEREEQVPIAPDQPDFTTADPTEVASWLDEQMEEQQSALPNINTQAQQIDDVSNAPQGNADVSDLPMQDIEDKGLAHTNSALKVKYRQLFDWAKRNFGKELVVSGGWRSPENNAANNGATKSHHLDGDAIDVDYSMFSPEEQQAIMQKAQEMGFNSDGDGMHDNHGGNGDHMHLTYEGGNDSGDNAPSDNGSFTKSSGNQQYDAWIKESASKHGVPANLLSSLLDVESGYNPNAKSEAGAVGIAQFMPSTAEGMGIDPTNPQEAIEGAARYLEEKYAKYGNWHQALEAYNGGDGNVGISETKAYADKVLSGAGDISSTSNSKADTNTIPADKFSSIYANGLIKFAGSEDDGVQSAYQSIMDSLSDEQKMPLADMFNDDGTFKNTSENRRALALNEQTAEMIKQLAQENAPALVPNMSKVMGSDGRISKENVKKLLTPRVAGINTHFLSEAIANNKLQPKEQKAVLDMAQDMVDVPKANLSEEGNLRRMNELQDAVDKQDFAKIYELLPNETAKAISMVNNLPQGTQTVDLRALQAQKAQEVQQKQAPAQEQTENVVSNPGLPPIAEEQNQQYQPQAVNIANQRNMPITASAIMQSAINGQPIDGNVLDRTMQQDLNNNQQQANIDRQAIDARMQKAGLAINPATPNAGIIVPNGVPAGTPDIVIPDTPKAPTVNTNDLMARLNDSPVFRQAKANGDIGAMANEADAMGFHKEAEQIRNSQYGNVPSKFDYKKRLSEVKKMSRADRIELGKELLNELEAKNIPVNDNLRNDLEHGVPKAIVNAEKKLANAETNDEAEQEVKPAEEATPAIAKNEPAENVTKQEVKAEKSAKEDTVLKGVSGIYESDIKDYIDRGYNIESYRGHLENGKPVYNLDFETSKDKARFVKDFYGESEEIDTDTSEPDYAKELDEEQEKKAGAEPAEEGNKKATNENNKKNEPLVSSAPESPDGALGTPTFNGSSTANISQEQKPSKGNLEQSSSQHFDITDYTHTKTGEVYNAAKINGKVDRDTYAKIKDIATKHGGRYNRFAKRFFFKDTGADGRNAFVAEAEREVFGEETKQEEKIAATQNETVAETKVQDSNSETENTNAENDFHGFLDGKTPSEVAKIKEVLLAKTDPFGGRNGYVTSKHIMETLARSSAKGKVKDNRYYINGNRTKKIAYEYFEYLRNKSNEKSEPVNSDIDNQNQTKYVDGKYTPKGEIMQGQVRNGVIQIWERSRDISKKDFNMSVSIAEIEKAVAEGIPNSAYTMNQLAGKLYRKAMKRWFETHTANDRQYRDDNWERFADDWEFNPATDRAIDSVRKAIGELYKIATGHEIENKFEAHQRKVNEKAATQDEAIKAPAKKETKAEPKKDSIFGEYNEAELYNALGIKAVEDNKSEVLPDNVPDGIEGTEEERARLREEIRKELNKISANPIFNPRLYTLSAKYVFSYMKSGLNDIKKLMTTLKAEFGNDFVKDWAPAVIETIRTYPKDIPFNESHVMAVIKSVGSLYENGTTDLDEITSKITAHMNDSAKKKFAPVIEASYNGVKKFFDVKKEADSHGVQQGQSGDADGGHQSVATGASQENEHKEAGEVSRPDGRETGRAVTNDDSKDTEKPATGGIRAGSKLETAGSTGADSGRNKPAVPLTEAQQNPSATETPGHDYEIKERSANKASAPERFKQNIKAIKLLKQLLADNRMPTPAEQKVLAEYNGWGGLKDAFREGTKENNELKELLSESEYKAAKASTLDAFYTAPSIVRAIWKGVSRLGFKGGRVLDPAMGIGNFYGCMPRDMMSKSKLYGVEMDELSSQFSKMLYPSAMVENKPFQSSKAADNFFDLVITNVPFSQAKAGGYMIHNFYFANGIDKVRPGGLMVYITSQGSLTGTTDAAKMRSYLAGRADVIGAYKLPEGAFKEAGTDVSVDVVIVRKRDKDNRQSEHAQSALEVKNFNIGYMAAPVNEYFLAHKNHIIGTKAVIGNDAYGNRVLKVKNESGQDVGKMLEKAMNDLPKDIYQPINRNNRKTYNTVDAMKRARVDDENIRDLEYYVKDGKLYQNDNGEAVPITGKNAPLIKSYVGIKSTLNSLFVAQRDPDVSDGTLDRLRGELNKRYDAFVKKYGYINDPKNVAKFAKDPSAGTIMALEKITFKGQGKKRTIESVEKADIFTERTMQAIKKVISAKNPNDALLASLNQLGHVDIDYMAKLLKTKPSQLEKALKGVIYKNPANETYETSDEYLSGNVREKLAQAEMAAEKDPAYKGNVEALKKVQPADLVTDEIIVNLGAPWIPVADVQAFVDSINSFKAGSLEIGYIPTLAKWTVSGMGRSTKFKADGITLPELLECILNNKSIQVYNGRGKDRVLDSEKTDAANVVADDIKDAFKHWLWQDKERADRLAKFYNENYNNMVLRKYDGAHLDFPGMNAKIHMKPHQKNVVWRMLQNGNTLIAHCVGAGKTFEMQAAGMEMRRLGLANKPLYCVPNNVVEQFAREFRQLYPNAKLLVVKSGSDLPTVRHPKVTTTEDGRKKVIPIDLKEMTKAERDKLLKARAERNRALARIQTEDWDGIIMSHTMFERLPLSKETLTSYIQEELDMLERTVKQHKGDNLDKRTENALEARKESLKNKIDEIMNMDAKDIGIPFEEIGIDQIFVDEADMFKNLHYTTAIGNVSGLTNSNANRSMDMFVKTQYLTRLHDGRGVVFATGTPISNTMAEMYTMMRYLDSRGLKEKGVELFDSWIRTFGEIGTGIERKPSGDGFRKVNKIKNFINMAELTKMFRKFADVKRQEDLNLDIPKLKNDKPTVVALEPDPEIVRYIREVVPERVADMKKNAYKKKKGADNMLKLTGDLRKMALSDAKIEVCADKIAEVFDRTADVKGAQLVFCDLGIPKAENEKANADTDSDKLVDDGSEGDNASVYDRLMDALKRRGIPDEQIAFVQQAKNKDEQAELFQKVDRGDLRILIGSTARMGAGTNCQHHLVALHDLDAPWRPRDLEQRHGRILRQGNQNSEVEIFNYVIKDSFDANMWEKLKNKASIIAQAMSDNTNLRVVEDADIATLSYAEIEGAATGNPLIKDQLKLNNEVTKYSHASTEFNRKVHTAETQLQTLPEKIAGAEGTIGRIERDIKARKSTRGDDFAIILDGKTYTKRADADKALAGINAKLDNVPKEIGSIGGFKIKASLYKVDAFSEATPMYQLVKNYSYHTQTSSIAGIENCLAKNPEKELKQLTNERDRLNMLLEEAKEIAAQKNPYTEKLAELNKKLKDINRQIETAMVDKHYSVSENKDSISPADNVKEQISEQAKAQAMGRLRTEIAEALPTAKNIRDDGSSIKFTMLNKAEVEIQIADELTVDSGDADKARKAHGLEAGVKIKVNGKEYTIGSKAVIQLALNGDEGSVYHEVFHAVWDMVLTNKEKAAIIKAYKEDARKAGKDVIEYAADRYRDWFLARNKGVTKDPSGNSFKFGKLWKKFREMVDKLRSIIAKTEEVNRIFKDIESGKVWERELDNALKVTDNEIKQMKQELAGKLKPDMTDDELDQAFLGTRIVRELRSQFNFNIINNPAKAYEYSCRFNRLGEEFERYVSDNRQSNAQSGATKNGGTSATGDKGQSNNANRGDKEGTEKGYTGGVRELNARNQQPEKNVSYEVQSVLYLNDVKAIHDYEYDNNNKFSVRRSDKDGFSNARYSLSESEKAGTVESFKKATKKLLKVKTESNVTDKYSEKQEKKKETPDGKLPKSFIVQSMHHLAKSSESIKRIYNLATKAMEEQEKLRNGFKKSIDKVYRLTKDSKDREALNQILWAGDAEGKDYSRRELHDAGYSDNVIEAYKTVRDTLADAYNKINDARMQVMTRNANIASSNLEKFMKEHFLKDTDIISKQSTENGKILVTYKGCKVYENQKDTVDKAMLDQLKADDNVYIKSADEVTPGVYEVTYNERPKAMGHRNGYMPHFFHNFMVYAIAKDADGKALKDEYGNDLKVAIGSAESLAEATKMANKAAQANKDTEFVIDTHGFNYGDETNNNVVVGDREYQRMITNLAHHTEMTRAEANKYLHESAGVSLKSRHRFFGNMMKRKGSEGYEKEFGWALTHYLNSSARYVAMEKFKPRAINFYERYFGDFNGDPDKIQNKNKRLVANRIKRFISDFNGNPSTVEEVANDIVRSIPVIGDKLNDVYNGRPALALSSKLSWANATMKLGCLNIASPMLNYMQLVNIVTALDSNKYPAMAMKKVFSPHGFTELDKKILEESGVMNNINMSSDAGGYTQNRRYDKIKENKLYKWLITPALFEKCDLQMRQVAVLGAYYQGIEKKGMKIPNGKEISPEAIEYAKEINREANFDYSAANTPELIRRGSVLTQQMFQFQKYPIMQFEFFWDNVVHGTNSQRIRFLVPYMLATGIAGCIPFGELLNALLSTLFGGFLDDDDLAKKAKAEMMKWAGKDPFLQGVVTTVTSGLLPAVTGIDISSRAGMHNFFSGEYYGNKPDSSAGAIAQSLTGATVSSIGNMFGQLFNGNKIEAIKALSPGIGNIIQGLMGETHTTHHRVASVYNTWYEQILHGLGFRHINESNTQFINSYLYEQSKNDKEHRKDLMDKALDNPTSENMDNLKVNGITDKQLKNYKKSRDKSSMERALGDETKKPKKKKTPEQQEEDSLRDFLR